MTTMMMPTLKKRLVEDTRYIKNWRNDPIDSRSEALSHVADLIALKADELAKIFERLKWENV